MNKLENLDKNMLILVADDLATVRRIIRVCLKSLGFQNVEEAESAQTALEVLDKNQVKLVISDWEFPDMQTEQLALEFGLRKAKYPIPVLLITNQMQRKVAERAHGLTVDSILVKPFTSDLLRSKLEAVL